MSNIWTSSIHSVLLNWLIISTFWTGRRFNSGEWYSIYHCEALCINWGACWSRSHIWSRRQHNGIKFYWTIVHSIFDDEHPKILREELTLALILSSWVGDIQLLFKTLTKLFYTGENIKGRGCSDLCCCLGKSICTWQNIWGHISVKGITIIYKNVGRWLSDMILFTFLLFQVKSTIPFSEPFTVDPENPPQEKDYNIYFKGLKDGITGKESLEQSPVPVWCLVCGSSILTLHLVSAVIWPLIFLEDERQHIAYSKLFVDSLYACYGCLANHFLNVASMATDSGAWDFFYAFILLLY